MKGKIFFMIVGAWLLAGIQFTEAAPRRIYVKIAPPAKKVAVIKQIARPHPNAIWVEGDWHWNGKNYVWKDGHWLKPRKHHVWVPGQWVKDASGWYWIEGHWIRVK